MANQSIDPALLALQTAKKAMPASPSTQAPMQSSLNAQKQQSQAISTNITPPVAKIGGISSPFGATNINSSPVLWWATPQEIGTRGKELQSLPKAMPTTWVSDSKDYKTLATASEKEAFSKMLKDWLSPERASAALKFAIDKRTSSEQPTTTQNIAWWLLNTAKKVWWWILWAATWLSTLYWAWEALKYAGKKIYSMTLPPTQREAEALQSYAAWTSKYKPKTAIETALEAPLISWNPLKSKSYWLIGTRSWIGIQAEAKADEVFKNIINPLLQKSKGTSTTVNVQWAVNEIWSDIIRLAKWDPDKLAEYKEAFSQLKESFSWKEFSNMELDKLHELKSWLQWRTPQKFFKWQEITNAYTELRWILSSKLTWKLHSAIKKDFGVESADFYKDYSNFKSVSEIWPKARTMGWLKWWFWWFWSTLADTALTPVTTVGWKIAYKAWQLAVALPESIVKWVTKWIKTIVKWWKLFSVLEDGTLIPWSPSNLANIAMSTPKDERISIKWTTMRVPKESFKYNDTLKMTVANTSLWYIDEEWNIIQ